MKTYQLMMMIFDLSKDVWYLDDATSRELTKDQKKALLLLPKQCKVYDWKNEYKGEEKEAFWP